MFKLGLNVLMLISVSLQLYANEQENYWSIQTSLYTTHFHPKPEHNNHQELLGVDYNLTNHWFYGGATFRNSFRQRSVYGYVGKRFAWENTPFYVRLSGGLLHGYHGKYKNKIPFNRYSVAPAVIPAGGIQISQFSAEIIVLGANAAMLNVGLKL